MSATDLLESLFRCNICKLSIKERRLSELIIFKYLYRELLQYFEINITEREENMLYGSIIRGIINELLLSEEYSLEGLANYTGYPEDVIYEIAAGININPTLPLSAKIIELHSLAKPEVYNSLIKKMVAHINKTQEPARNSLTN